MLRMEIEDKFWMCFQFLDALKKEVIEEKKLVTYLSLEPWLLSCIEELREKYKKRKFDEALDDGIVLCIVMVNVLTPANPLTQEMTKFIGDIYCAMQKYATALSIYNQVYQWRLQYLGEDNGKTLNSLMDKAHLLFLKCEFDSAWNAQVKVHRKWKTLLGLHDEKTLQSRQALSRILSEYGAYNRARKNFKAIYHIQSTNGLELDAISTAKNLASLYFKQRKYKKALEIWTKVYMIECERDSRDPETLRTRSNMAKVLAEEDKYDEAISIYKEILLLQKSSDIPEAWMDTENNKVMVIMKQERYNSARKMLKKLKSDSVRILGPEHSTTLSIQNSKAAIFCGENDFDKALGIYRKVRDVKEKTLGFSHTETLKATCNIARVYVCQLKYNESLIAYNGAFEAYAEAFKAYDEAFKAYDEARNLMRAVLSPEHIDLLSVDTEIAEVYINQRQFDKAFQIYYDVYERHAAMYGVDHRYTSKIKEKMLHLTPEEERLISATRKGNLDTVMSCLESGDDIDVRDICGYTPLQIASEKGNAEMLKLLLKNGAIYEVKNMEGKKPADIAGNNVVKDILHLVSHLFSLVEINDSEQVGEILDQEKAIINAKDKNGCSALHRACDMGCVNVVEALLDRGVNHKAVSKAGRTALHHAAFRGHDHVIGVLLKHVRKCAPDGFNAFLDNGSTTDGATALHLAARNNNYDAVHLLLENGANSDVKDKLKRLPSDVTDDKVVAERLRNHCGHSLLHNHCSTSDFILQS